MDRIEAMQAFVRVVETGSFTKASETLRLSRSRTTQLVQSLEAHLQVKLLHRTTRRVKATTDGAAYYERIVQLLAELDDIETSLASASALPRGRLRIDVPSPVADLILVPALPDFFLRYPEIRVDLGVSDRSVDLIDENVDCVIRGGALAQQSLRSRHVADLEFGLYAAPVYLSHAGQPAHPLALEGDDHFVVGYRNSRTGRTLTQTMRRGEEHVQVSGRHLLSVDDGNACLAAGRAGLGVVCLPKYMARALVSDGELVPLLEDWTLDPMPLHIAFPTGRRVSRRLRVFMDWFILLLARHAPAIRAPAPRG